MRVFVRRLQSHANLENTELADILKMSASDLELFFDSKKDLKLDQLQVLLEKYDLSMDALRDDKIDFSLISSKSGGLKESIFQRYLVGAFSKRRTAFNTLNYVKETRGYQVFDMTERYFQINDTIYSDPDSNINIHFIEDLYKYLSTYHKMTAEEFFEMGKFNLVTHKESSLKRSLSEARSPKELFEMLIERDITKIENNSEYQIKEIDEYSCTLQSKIKKDVKDILNISKIGNAETCKYREGFFSAVTGFIGLPFSQVREVSCVHRGDERCEFVVNYTQAYVSSRILARQPSSYLQ